MSSAPRLDSASAGTCGSGTVSVRSGRRGLVAVAGGRVADTWPPSRSACVSVWVPVQTSVAPGASVAGCDGVQSSAPSFGSPIVTPVSVTLPTLRAVSV